MPRATESPASRVLHFYRTAPIEMIELVEDLKRDILRQRRAEASTETGAAVNAATTSASGGSKPAKARKRQSRAKANKGTTAPAAASEGEVPATLPESGPVGELVGAGASA